jgi:hypothetical protein
MIESRKKFFMKKVASSTSFFAPANFVKRALLTFFAAILTLSSFAATITSVAGGGNWNSTATWVGGVIPTSTDDVVIAGNVTITAAGAACANLTVNSGVTLTLNNPNPLTVNSTLTNNGTLSTQGSNTISVTGDFINNGTFTLQQGSTLTVGGSLTNNAGRTINLNNTFTVNINGDYNNSGTLNTNPSGGTGNFTLHGNWVNNGAAFVAATNTVTVTMTKPGSYIGGTSASSFYNLVINPGVGNIVNQNTSNITILDGGKMTLQSGIYKTGASSSANTITFAKAATIDGSSGGNFASSLDGLGDTDADGGNFIVNGTSGPNVTFTTSAANAFRINNITSQSPSDGNWHLNITNANSVLILGTLKITNGGGSNQFSVTGNSPQWGPSSSLYWDRNGQAYNPGLEWVIAGGCGIIGTTAGYPNNVTLVNIGSSPGWQPAAGTNICLNGTFTIGDPAFPARTGVVDLVNVNSFKSNGIVINGGSTFKSPAAGKSFIDNGNFTIQGSPAGTFTNNGATITFSGSGTSASPQTVSTTGASIAFGGITVNNGTYVQLQSPVTTSATGTLNLTSGYIGTTATNSLTVLNTATTAVTGGSPTAYVDGPLKWNIPASPSGTYTFPIGDLSHNGGAYLPLKLTPTTTSATTVTATAFNQNSNGTMDATLTSISTTEYWSVSATTAFTTGAAVDVTRPAPISPFTSLAKSTSAGGTYTSITGTPISGTEIGSGAMGTTNPEFIVMAAALPIPLSVTRTGGIVNLDANCNPTTGTLIVSGVGGTGPYQYSMTSATGPWQASNTFSGLAVGSYTVWVQDNATPTPAVASATLQVLGPLQINGNNQDITVCSSQPVTLTATNPQNPNPTYLWSPGGQTTASITVSPVSTTTYTITSTVPFTGANMLTNGSFQGGAFPTGFVANYTNYGGAAYGTTPGSGAYYKVSNAGTNLCIYFAAGGAEDGDNSFFIADGGTSHPAQELVYTLNLTGLTIGQKYAYSFWYKEGSPTAPFATLETDLNGSSLGSVVANNSSWAQASYTFTAAATTATITFYDRCPTTSTDGNDFYIDNLQLQPVTTCNLTASMTINVGCPPQPVELIYFNAAKQGSGALVSWATASEINSSYFVIEKSSDGINFTSAGKVNAAGSSAAVLSYSFFDASPLSGITYYRLAQYDINGSVHYSDVKALSDGGLSGVQIIPNPNNGVFVIMLPGHADKTKSRISIVNSLGQILYESAGFTDNFKSVDISHLPAAIYYLEVSSDEGTAVKKILKE